MYYSALGGEEGLRQKCKEEIGCNPQSKRGCGGVYVLQSEIKSLHM